jgi:hypothetical protein
VKLAALLAFLAACAAARGVPPRKPVKPPAPLVARVYVSCMAEPPPFDAIDWPTPDSVGNVLLHRSTVDRVQGAYATLRRYVSEQYFRCLHVAEAASDGVTVEMEP